jgi:PAS domain S-box-containing protein
VEPTLANFLESLHPADRPRVERAVNDALRPENSGRYAQEYRTRALVKGEEHWISAWGRVLFDEQGKPFRFLGVVRDITEKKRAERDLQFQLQLTACITEQSTDCILLVDLAGALRFLNPEAERVFGYTLEQFRDKTPHELLHHHYPNGRPFPGSECKLSRHMASGELLRDYEDVFFTRNGTPIDMAVSCAPLELNGARIGSVFTFRDITERKRAERALRQSDERFRRLFEADIIGIMVSDREHILEANDQFLRMLGYTREAFKPGEISWRAITPAEYIEVSERGRYLLSTTGVCPAIEKEYIRRDGSRVPVLLAAVELNRTAEQLLCFALDLTDRKSLENQFRQSQKLESVGLLAGGVAHDFNNLLTIIMGYARMVRDQVHRQHPMRDALDQISAAADRAAGLTRQLLTFSRRNTSVPKILNLDSLVRDIEKMLRRLIGEHIEVILATAADAGFVHADPGLIEQVIVNLVVNARDAMPNGGKLFIETSRIAVADDFAALAFSIPRGTYISLGVTDTGTGMTPEVQSRLFEPFFTTKEPGKGTGLGLSTVYGIVKQSGGSITVHSTLGIGTSVRVLFPAVDGGTYVPEQTENTGKSVRGTETVLLVEDEPGVRNYIREVLDTHGYRTLDTSRGPEAIELARHYGGPIHLLLTDMVLPGMNGSEVIRQFLAVRPGVPVIRMSGYSERLGAQLDDSVPLLQKPFTPRVLLYRIRDMLDGG